MLPPLLLLLLQPCSALAPPGGSLGSSGAEAQVCGSAAAGGCEGRGWAPGTSAVWEASAEGVANGSALLGPPQSGAAAQRD